MSDKDLRCWARLTRYGTLRTARETEDLAMMVNGESDDRLIEMAPLAELERVRAQRDKLALDWHASLWVSKGIQRHEWEAAYGLRIINGKVEEIEGA